jgi:UDP-N-acetylmuramoylalanine--D-glutamate ligase
LTRIADLQGRAVGVWGFGREGRAVVSALEARLEAVDLKVYTPETVEDRHGSGALFVSGEDPSSALGDREVVVRSPGVSAYHADVRKLRQAGVTFTTGSNLWHAEVCSSTPVVAVTGTKGKSTTASLLAHLLREDGGHVTLAGNVGVPLLSLVDTPTPSVYVVELSSYQIADLDWSPTAGVILNLFPEHTDWHGGEDRYYQDKLRLARSESTVPVINALDPMLRAWGERRTGVQWFGDHRGIHLSNRCFVRADGSTVASLSDSSLRGEHNLLNTCAALTALEVVGQCPRDVAPGLRTFKPLPHRLEEIGRARGRTWVDDSISTTPEATIAAIRSFPSSIVTVIAGGFDRGQRYTDLARALSSHRPSATAIALPPTGARLVSALESVDAGVPAYSAVDLEHAVALATEATPQGGVVLLSPGAPSYGAYRNFEERGNHFARLVRVMQEG